MKHIRLKNILMVLVCFFTLGLGRVASAHTGIFVNGYELSPAQVFMVSQRLGVIPARGSYWYNPRTGAYGRMGSYGSGSSDRFWSTSYSAGNSTADNSQGYVSVPGYGPVSYGM